jgi:hypothetical protein
MRLTLTLLQGKLITSDVAAAAEHKFPAAIELSAIDMGN